MLQYRNREWLEGKYIKEKLSQDKIAKLCNVNQNTIWKWLHKYNIPTRSISEGNHLRQANHCNLSIKAIEWINGELLGDGSVQLVSKYSARFTYGSKYLEYIEYVRDTLKSFGIKQAGKICKQINKRQGNVSYHYYSCGYPELLIIRKQWYPEGKKIIPRDIKITPITVRQHYIGDGNIYCPKTGNPSIRLCTYGFTVMDVEYYMGKLVELGIKATRNIQNAINISAYSVKDFLKYIGDCPVECYQYKWGTMKYASIPV